jgi:hypothetical protein
LDARRQVLCVFHDARPCWGCSTYTEIEVGGVRARFESTTSWDLEPDAIAPAAKLATAPGAFVDFDPVTITGIDKPVDVGVVHIRRFPPDVSPAASDFSVGCTGTYTHLPTQIQPGQALCARHVASLMPNTVTSTYMKIGEGAYGKGAANVVTFTSSTGSAIDTTPDSFRFVSDVGVRRAGTRARGATISGLGAPAAISVVGGRATDGSGSRSPASVTPGAWSDGIGVEHYSAHAFGASTTTTVEVGGVAATFTSRTTMRGALTSGALRDFNGDAREDLIWRNDSTGEVASWLLWGSYFEPTNPFMIGRTLLAGRPEWVPVHFGDFDADSVSDILWRNGATGETALWLMADGQFREGAIVMSDPVWTATHLGDFDGDGTTDIVWTNQETGTTALWLMRGLGFHSGGMLLTHPDWRVRLVGDLDGDGKSDLIWHNAMTGQTAAWLMEGLATKSGSVLLTHPEWQVRVLADLDGDDMVDLAWHNAATGQTALWLMQGSTMKAGRILPDVPSAPTAAADFDADGKMDLLLDRQGATALYSMNGLQVRSIVFFLNPFESFVRTMDFDGDGRAEVISRNSYQYGPGYCVNGSSRMLENLDWRPF